MLGSITKETYEGKFITEYKAALAACGKGFEDIDCSIGIANVLSIKDEDEVVCFFFKKNSFTRKKNINMCL